MNIIRFGRNITIIAFLLSLLFHGSSVLYIFTQKTYNNLLGTKTEQSQEQEKQEQQNHTPQPWVETKARANNFGAPVFFKDDPSTNEDNIESTNQHALEQSSLEEKTEANDQLEQDDQSKQDDQHEKKAINSKQEETKEINNHPTEIISHIVDTSKHVQSTTASKKTHPQKTIRRARKKMSTNTHTSIGSAPKPPITLAQLAQGFLHQRKEMSGSYGISMMGMKVGIPSDEQMKYERYLQKLSWCIQNSFRINAQQHPPLAYGPTVHVFFSLNRDGTLRQLAIKKSSGNMYIDQFVIFVFRDASSSFPPVPGYLTDDPFNITCIVS